VGITHDAGGFEFRDPPPELVVQALLSRQLLLDALESSGRLLVTFVLSVDDEPLMLTEDAPLVCQLCEQPLDVVEGGLRPLVIEFVELLASEHGRPTSSARKVASG